MADHIVKKKKYPRLTELGVHHPAQITRYSVSSLDFVDFVTLVYERPKGSLLPVTRTFRFPRVQKNVTAADGDDDPEVVMESSPQFREILGELKGLEQTKATADDIAETILDELRCLSEDVSSHVENVKSLLDRMQNLS